MKFLFTVVKRNSLSIKMVIQTNNINNNIDNNNNSNNNNNNNSSNDVIIKSIKNGKSKYVLLLPDLSQKRMGLLKRKNSHPPTNFMLFVHVGYANFYFLFMFNIQRMLFLQFEKD